MHLKCQSAKWQPFCLRLKVFKLVTIREWSDITLYCIAHANETGRTQVTLWSGKQTSYILPWQDELWEAFLWVFLMISQTTPNISLMVELWGSIYFNLWDDWPCYIKKFIYVYIHASKQAQSLLVKWKHSLWLQTSLHWIRAQSVLAK